MSTEIPVLRAELVTQHGLLVGQDEIRMYRMGEFDDDALDAEHAIVKGERARLTGERDALSER